VNEKDQNTLPAIRKLFPNNQVVWRLNSPVGAYARALQVPAGETAHLALAQPGYADFGGKLQLVGFNQPTHAGVGGELRVTLAIKDLAPLDQLYKIFVHLRNAGGTIVTQDDHAPCAMSLNEADWRPGNIVLEDYALPVPVDLPPGRYNLVAGIYRAPDGPRLPVRASDLPHDADGVTLGMIDVK
jgi:hypothetical protein